MTALGTDAAGVFARHAAVAEALVAIFPAAAPLLKTRPDGWTIIPEVVDGAITGRLTLTPAPEDPDGV